MLLQKMDNEELIMLNIRSFLLLTEKRSKGDRILVLWKGL